MGEARQASSSPWRRHDLLHVAPDVWASAMAHRPALTDLLLVRTWADRGWPVIVRRRAEAEDPDLAPVGARCRRPPASVASPSSFRQMASSDAHLPPRCVQSQALRAQGGNPRSPRFWTSANRSV
jgi:hypothetical protein